jgi:hypothetical protein
MLLSTPFLYIFSALDQIARMSTPFLYTALSLIINIPFFLVQTCDFMLSYPLYTLESLVLGACAAGLTFTLFGASPVLLAIAGTVGFLSGLGMHHPMISAFFVTRNDCKKINLLGKGLARWGLILLAALLLTPGVIMVAGLPTATMLGMSMGVPVLASIIMPLVAQVAITAAAALTCILLVTVVLAKLTQWVFFPIEKSKHNLLDYAEEGYYDQAVSSETFVESRAYRPAGAFSLLNGDAPDKTRTDKQETETETTAIGQDRI